jgi:hypothetical protein
MRRPLPVLIAAAFLNISAGLGLAGLIFGLFAASPETGLLARVASALLMATFAVVALLAAGGLWRMRRWGVVLYLLLLLLGLLVQTVLTVRSPGHLDVVGDVLAAVLAVGAARYWRRMTWAPLPLAD